MHGHEHAQSLQSCRPFATLWTVAHQASLSMGFSRQGILEWAAMPSFRRSSRPRTEPMSPMSPARAGRFFTPSYHLGSPQHCTVVKESQPKRWEADGSPSSCICVNSARADRRGEDR